MLGLPVIDLLVKKDSLLVCVLKFFGISTDRYGSVVVRVRQVRVRVRVRSVRVRP